MSTVIIKNILDGNITVVLHSHGDINTKERSKVLLKQIYAYYIVNGHRDHHGLHYVLHVIRAYVLVTLLTILFTSSFGSFIFESPGSVPLPTVTNRCTPSFPSHQKSSSFVLYTKRISSRDRSVLTTNFHKVTFTATLQGTVTFFEKDLESAGLSNDPLQTFPVT